MRTNTRLVYSTAGTNVCSRCGKSLAKCACSQKPAKSSTSDGIIRIARETKGRKGKGVTLIKGVELTSEELQQLAKRLKALCGSGGTVKDSIIEIQGDHRQQLKKYLEEKQTQKVILAGG